MDVAVIGAGAIGGTIAVLLQRAGHTVQVTARGDQLTAIRADGLQLSGGFGEHRAAVEAVPTLTRPADLVFVTTKAQDADAAVKQNLTALRHATLVVVQNGLESIEGARRTVPTGPIVGALAVYAASYLSPGRVLVTAAGQTWLGGDPDATRRVAETMRGVMPITVTRNFEGAQWTKLIVNHVNALPAITGLSVQEVIADRRLRMVMTESMREACRVARACGIRFDSLQGLSNTTISVLLLPPAQVGQLLPLLLARRMGSRPNPGSTLQSIRRGQPTEIDYLNGAIVRRGREHGVPTPVSTALVNMVRDVERTGEFLTAGEAIRRSG